jgi:sugar (pentulose or hexulose) kinase
LLAPRDLVVARLVGTVVTDPTLASRTGWYALDGTARADGWLAERLPDIVPSTAVLPVRTSTWSAALALPDTAVVVPGAGDRACEAIGTGARSGGPMVSWGTTANVSVPHPGPVGALPAVAQVSRMPGDDFLVEAGLAAAGSAFDWLAALTGRTVADLWAAAATVPPGARGATAYPWFTGARAPHWRPGATASFAGLRPDHSPADLARAVAEGVAYDVARSLELLDPGGSELVVAGGGADNSTWRAVLGAVTARAVVVRRHAEAASVGARVLAAQATGDVIALDTVNPIVSRAAPDPSAVQTYAALREDADRRVGALLGVDDRSEETP